MSGTRFFVSWRQACGSRTYQAFRSARQGGDAAACLEPSMGKRNRLREARRREAELRVSALLEANSRVDARPRAPDRFVDFKPEYRDKLEALRSHALRAPEDWHCRIKSRLEERRFTDLLRFTFARYSVAPHLERVW